MKIYILYMKKVYLILREYVKQETTKVMYYKPLTGLLKNNKVGI